MTIKLTAAYGKYPHNAIITLDANTEAALIAAGGATATLGGGVPYSDPNPSSRIPLTPAAAASAQEAYDKASSFGIANRSTVPNSGVYMPNGVGFFSLQSPEAQSNTFYCKYELEGPFDWVRFHIFNKDPGRTMSQWEIIAAPTDEPLNNNQNNAFTPMQGGVSNNFFAEDIANEGLLTKEYGWRRARWGYNDRYGSRSRSGTLPPASLNNEESNLASNNFCGFPMLSTERVACPSLAPNTGSGRHHLLMRATYTPSSTEGTFYGNSAASSKNSDGVGSGLSWFRKMAAKRTASVDGVNTLATMPTALTDTTYLFEPPPIAIEVGYRYPVRSVLAVGDSVTENGGYQLYQSGNWLNIACAQKSTPTAPVVPYNAGSSNMTTVQYMKTLHFMLQRGMRFTDIVLPNLSANDIAEFASGTPLYSDFWFARLRSLILENVALARRSGARVYLWGNFVGKAGIGSGATSGGNGDLVVAACDAHTTWTKNVCAAGLAVYVDWVGVAVSGDIGADLTHPSPAGHSRMGNLLASLL